MKLFSKLEKKIARENSAETLKSARSLSIRRMNHAAEYGDSKTLKAAMTEYSTYNRALLYQRTPAYRRKILIKGGF